MFDLPFQLFCSSSPLLLVKLAQHCCACSPQPCGPLRVQRSGSQAGAGAPRGAPSRLVWKLRCWCWADPEAAALLQGDSSWGKLPAQKQPPTPG